MRQFARYRRGRLAELDPHEEKARLGGPFAPGAKGWNKPKGAPAGTFAITAVEPERMWWARALIPSGR